MNGYGQELAELAPVLWHEGRRRVLQMALLFAAIAVLALVAGVFWPRTYSVTTTVLAQSSDIIQPLMEGRAVPTGTADRAGLARQVIFSRKVLDELLETGGWDGLPPLLKDKQRDEIRNSTEITAPRADLLQIRYRDHDPQRAYRITRRMADLFIAETLAGKEQESRDAYEFIDDQVQDYHRKLLEAEQALHTYRANNIDAQPGSAADSSSRIAALRTEVERNRMQLMEQQSGAGALGAQLSGESEVTAVQTREGLYKAQLMDLQQQLDRLLLTYTEQYPDVVRIRHQMADIQRLLASEAVRPQGERQAGNPFDNAQFNPHYQELRRQLGDANRQVAATRSRLAASQQMLEEELERSRRIAASESTLAELTRDYEVNQEIYQDLLKRRENARLSMNMDAGQRGLTLRVQNPALPPLRPSGLRMVHFAAGGLLLGMAMPLGLLFGLVRVDPRVRSLAQLERAVPGASLTRIPFYATAADRRRRRRANVIAVLVVAAVLAAYVATYLTRLYL